MVQQAAVALGAQRVEPGPGPYPGRLLPGADGEDGRPPKDAPPRNLLSAAMVGKQRTAVL